jgi:hypothetical protein
MRVARPVTIIAFGVLLLVFVCPAFAQQKTLGLVMGYPTLVGVHWQPSHRVGIRVDGSIDFNSTKQTTPSNITLPELRFESSSRMASLGVSVCFTLAEQDQLTWYFTPRVAWLSTTTESTPAVRFVINGQPSQSEQKRSHTESGKGIAGLLGARYRFADRIAAFAEAGVEYDDLGIGFIGESEIEARHVGLKTNLGLVIYF